MSNDGDKKSSRLSISLSATEMEQLDQWAWAQRIRSLSDAGRQLIVIGLAAHAAGWTPEGPPAPKRKPRKSE